MSELIEVKTSELTGYALDWAVAKANGYECGRLQGKNGTFGCNAPGGVQYVIGILRVSSLAEELNARFWRPSTDWAQGGPLLDSMVIGVIHNSRIRPHPFDKGYQAMASHFIGPSEGHTILIAACRAIVAAKMGDVVHVPEELGVVK